MHSLAIAQGILQAALAEAEKYGGRRIKAINVKIGDEHFTESDSIQFCLEAMAKGTVAEGAQIKVEVAGAATWPPGNLKGPIGEEPLSVTLELD